VVNSVVFSGDGRQIVAASDDWTVRLYPCATCGSTAQLLKLSAGRIY
jgi:WD40 repeat protein